MKDTIMCIGEALIDLIPAQKGVALKDVTGFERVAGGAPTNVAAAVAKLGQKSSVISKLGIDAFGDYIIEVLEGAGVDTSKIYRTKEANTALAFVSLKNDGNRDFSFYRNPSADMLLREDEIKEDWFDSCCILHFCSVDLIEAPVKYAHKKAIEYAMEKECIISFDPNVRLPLWDSPEDCKKAILEFLPKAHILKISDEELEFITGYSDINEAKDFLFEGNCIMLIYTKGADGAELYTKDKNVTVEGIKTEVIDTTGAGDSFIGAFLYSLMEEGIDLKELEKVSEDKLKEILNFANIYASHSTTKKGAIAAMATKEEVEKLI